MQRMSPGMTNVAGDVLRMEIRHATPSYVLLMSTSLPHVCTSCPDGTTNAAGDDASGQTQNVTPLHVLLMSTSLPMSVTSCPSGTTNVAGDDASGVDTECDPTLCSVNEHVVSHVCTDLSSWYDKCCR